jgi:3-phosphoshikimate 1-carboxyvinyltransferase
MGANISCRAERLPPLRIAGARLSGINYELPVASAQVKSCLLLAGLLADGQTRILEPAPSRDHTERMLAAAGAEVGRDGDAVTIRPAAALEPRRIAVPGDISAAAFFVVGASIVAGSELALTGVGLNPTRTGLLEILGRMGAAIAVEPTDSAGEPSGTLRVAAAELRGTEVGGAEVPLAIDELPLVALAACFAEGETRIRDALELRRKESDRIATVCEALAALGGDVEPTEDGLTVRGSGGLRGGMVASRGDHRIAMMGAIAGLASREGVDVEGMEAAAISYPGFEADLAAVAWSSSQTG